MKKIYGIGVDIEQVQRFKKKVHEPNFLNKVFTPKEIKLCKKRAFPEQHFAVRFAAKEAIFKAIGDSDKLYFKDAEILNQKNGQPYIHFLKKKYQSLKCWISLSHTVKDAIAFVVLLKK